MKEKPDFLFIGCVGIPILISLIVSLVFFNFSDITTLFVSIAFLFGLLTYKILKRKNKNIIDRDLNSNKLKQKIYNLVLLIILTIIIIILIWGKLSLAK